MKRHRQIAKFGKSLVGMPPIDVYEATDGELLIYDGVTRATRAAKLCPGELVPVRLVGRLAVSGREYPTIEERLP